MPLSAAAPLGRGFSSPDASGQGGQGAQRRVAYQVAGHQRVQNIGLKIRDLLALAPHTKVTVIERCSGHDGSYAVKTEFHKISMKIGRPVARRVKIAEPDYYTSDCAMAARHIEHGLNDGTQAVPPFSFSRKVYGI